jgi:hypothetical protein
MYACFSLTQYCDPFVPTLMSSLPIPKAQYKFSPPTPECSIVNLQLAAHLSLHFLASTANASSHNNAGTLTSLLALLCTSRIACLNAAFGVLGGGVLGGLVVAGGGGLVVTGGGGLVVVGCTGGGVVVGLAGTVVVGLAGLVVLGTPGTDVVVGAFG